MTLKQTSLHSVHAAAGAKLVDFGGWDMPLHYGSQLDEHHAVRTGAGMFDVSHMCTVDVRGAPCRDFLRYLLANHVDKLTVSGKALYSCMLNPEGGVIDDLIVYYLSEEFFRLVINAGTAEKDLTWMEKIRHEKNFSVTITPRRDLAMLAVQGPEAREKFWQARPAWKAWTENLKPFFAQLQGEVMVARTGYTGEDGFEVSLPAEQAAALWADLQQAGVRPCGLGARDTLRLEAGMNLYANEMDDTVSPLDAGLAWTVSQKDERDFVGRSALLAQGQRFEFFGLVLLNKGVMRGHQTVITAHGTGELTSGTFSPTLGVSIAMARLPLGVQAGDEVQVDIRGKAVPARIVKLPFVRQGKILVSVS
jgi:aminomethyltransferase